MSLTMRREDYDALFTDHPELLDDDSTIEDMNKHWQYDPLRVASARTAALWRRDVTRPIAAVLETIAARLARQP